MNKQEFLAQLRRGLSGLPRDDIEARLIFYSEMIDDRMEEGLTEAEAVSAAGSVDEIAAQAAADFSAARITGEPMKSRRRLKAWEIMMLALGSPLWLSLGIAAFAAVFSVYAAACAAVISLWAVFASLIGGSLGGVIAGIVFACSGNMPAGAAMLGAGIICTGFSIFMFFGCKIATKGILMIAKKFAGGIRKVFAGRRKAG